MSEEIPTEGTEESQPAPKKVASYNEVHTAENAPMNLRVDDKSEIIGDLSESQKEEGFLTVLLGNSKKDYVKASTLIGNWMALSAARIAHMNEEFSDEQFEGLRLKWVGFVEKEYPEISPADAELLAEKNYIFMRDFQDELKIRSRVVNEQDLTNLVNRGGGHVTGDIMGRKPSNTSDSFSISQRMLRGVLKSKGEALNFDLLLRNSYVSLSFSKPDRTTMGGLIHDINRTIGGYVRQLNHNSAVIAKIAMMKTIWNFLHKRIISCSVSDIGSFSELARVIRINDFDTICMGLVESYNTKGIHLYLGCLGSGCGWGEHKLVDPKLLVRHRPSLETDEDRAIYGNLFNGTKTLTAEETLELSSKQTYGLETNRIYNETKDVFLEIGNPTLAEAFQSFDYFVGGVNPRIQEIRSTILNPSQAEDEVNLLLNELGSTEYMHWVSGYGIVAPVDSDLKDEIFTRSSTEDSLEFIKGVKDVLIADNHLNRELVKFVINKSPYMSKVVVGVRNFDCPKCHKNSELLQDPELKLDRAMGYTPIDAALSFFTLTQLALTRELANQVRTRQEATSKELQ